MITLNFVPDRAKAFDSINDTSQIGVKKGQVNVIGSHLLLCSPKGEKQCPESLV
jgi:hypothetical protein